MEPKKKCFNLLGIYCGLDGRKNRLCSIEAGGVCRQFEAEIEPVRIYIVKYWEGKYDDRTVGIKGVYLDPAKAEERKSKIISRIEQLAKYHKDHDCPVDFEKREEWSDAEYKKWSQWEDECTELYDYVDCGVVEYVLNQPSEK